jgi:nucleotide-binding universal stress UspA family protein
MKRLLVPVDFSPAMDGVLALARQLADALQAELHLVHVREIAALPVFPAATTGYPGIGSIAVAFSPRNRLTTSKPAGWTACGTA